ncbi:MAG: hypothetical protein AAB375_01700 [Patescibacteria group bacterium]
MIYRFPPIAAAFGRKTIDKVGKYCIHQPLVPPMMSGDATHIIRRQLIQAGVAYHTGQSASTVCPSGRFNEI